MSEVKFEVIGWLHWRWKFWRMPKSMHHLLLSLRCNVQRSMVTLLVSYIHLSMNFALVMFSSSAAHIYLYIHILNIVSYGDDALLHQDQIKLMNWFPPPKCNAMQIREITWGLQDNSGCSSTYSLDKVYETFICVLWVGYVSAVARVCCSCSQEEHLMFSLFGGHLFVVDLSAFISMFMFLCCFDDVKRNPEVVRKDG